MNERVEEIRRQSEAGYLTAYAPCDVATLLAALAQAERERDGEQRLRVQLSEDSQRHLDQFVEARAEVERLLAALAQAEREREEIYQRLAPLLREVQILVAEDGAGCHCSLCGAWNDAQAYKLAQ